MKNIVRNFRLSESEDQKLIHDAKAAGMSTSDYFRALLMNSGVATVDHSREIMTHVCKLYSLINTSDISLMDAVREELDGICRLLQA